MPDIEKPIKPYLERLTSLTNVLEESENKRQKIIDFMRQAPCICFIKEGATGKYEYVNNALCEAMGLTEDQVIGKTDLELIDLPTAQISVAVDLRILKDKQPIVTIEQINHKMYIVCKFLVVNGGDGVGGFGLELPTTFRLEYAKGA